jgi:6-phosphogluconolactonase
MAPSRRSPGATRPLSAAETDPAQIGFNKEGTVLLVTENATSRLTTYTVNPDGIPNAPQSRPAALPTPFGFQFGDRHVVFVSQANPGNPGAVSSYLVNPETGEVSTAIDTLTAENAACWVALSSDQTVGYTTNTGSASISLFRIRFDGALDPFFLRERPSPRETGRSTSSSPRMVGTSTLSTPSTTGSAPSRSGPVVTWPGMEIWRCRPEPTASLLDDRRVCVEVDRASPAA